MRKCTSKKNAVDLFFNAVWFDVGFLDNWIGLLPNSLDPSAAVQDCDGETALTEDISIQDFSCLIFFFFFFFNN